MEEVGMVLPQAFTGTGLRAVAITGGKNVPSRRFRVAALVPELAGLNIELSEICPIVSIYPPSQSILRVPWLIGALLERATFPARSIGYDAVILQRELISTLPTFERFLPQPRILDVDDAIYLRRGGRAAKTIARSCALVICGNDHLAEHFSKWNSNVLVIPTGVDTDQLRPIRRDSNSEPASIIGWIGTSGNYDYLEMIKPALGKVLAAIPRARLQIISNQFPEFLQSFGDQLDFKLWRPGIENELLPNLSVGIMPLRDGDWERGKCAFKMLQYMSAGVPVAVSPVGVNESIIDKSRAGYSADSINDWVDVLMGLLKGPQEAFAQGIRGREFVEKHYSLKRIAQQWSDALRQSL
jgi:glycosyltransferase involved in cell wall biosynthesis